MQPHFAILFLVVSSAFLHFTTAERGSWKDLPAILESLNVRLGPPSSSSIPRVLGVLLTNSSSYYSHDIQTQPTETLFEETSKITHSVETLIDNTVALGTALHDILLSGSLDGAAPLNNPLLTPLLKEIAKIVAIAQEQFRTKFPLPSTAPGHTQRTKRVSEVLEHLQRVVVRLARDQGIELEATERHLARIDPFIHSTLVLVGDVAELYPAAVQALVLSLSAVLLPETMVLPMFMLYSLGPHVLGEDAINEWLLKFVSENLRV